MHKITRSPKKVAFACGQAHHFVPRRAPAFFVTCPGVRFAPLSPRRYGARPRRVLDITQSERNRGLESPHQSTWSKTLVDTQDGRKAPALPISNAAPPIPSDLELGDMTNWFPMYFDRLRRSDLMAQANNQQLGAALRLWLYAWEQRPAGSIANSMAIVARVAGYDLSRQDCAQNSLQSWEQDCEIVLSGFLACSDGRIYHKVLSQIALEQHHKLQVSHQKHAAKAESIAKARASIGKEPEKKPRQKTALKPVQSTALNTGLSSALKNAQDRDRDLERNGGKLQTVEVAPTPPEPPRPDPWADLRRQCQAACNGARMELGAPGLRNMKPIADLLSKGIKLTTVLAAIQQVSSRPGKSIGTWLYFEQAIEELHAMGGGKPTAEPPLGHPLRDREAVIERGEPRCAGGHYDHEWYDAVDAMLTNGKWPASFGSKPGTPGSDYCRCPNDILTELCDKHGVQPEWYPPKVAARLAAAKAKYDEQCRANGAKAIAALKANGETPWTQH